MLQPQYLRSNTQEAIERLKKRNIDAEALINKVLELDDERKKIQFELDTILAQVNQVSKSVGELMKSGKKEEAEVAKQSVAGLKDQSKSLETNLTDVETSLTNVLYTIPNTPADIVPEGKTPEDNLTVKEVGTIPSLFEGALPHWDLCSKYKLIDFELGVKITGAGFPVYTGKGARLNRALVNLFLDYNTNAGYTEYQPPIVVNEASGYGTGQLPDKEGQMYHSTADNLYLIPTAEVPLTNFFRDEIVKAEDLPIKLTAYTPCFRREAGSYGKDVRGLNRLHQFDKVEIVQVSHPDKSYELLDEMVAHVAGLLDILELPYRILRLCGGDMGFTSALTYDFEVYSAGQGRWLEVSSVSNFETFQANRLKLRYKEGNEKAQLAHTLNGSSLAFPRIIAALLENNQTPEGIKLPKKLAEYIGFETIA